MKRMMLMTLVVIASGTFAQMPTVKMSELENILTFPITVTKGKLNETIAIKTPQSPVPPGSCGALRVSDLIQEKGTGRIVGALGSYVYPTIAEGAFAMTNQIFAAVAKVTGGNAMVVPPHMNKKGKCMEMTYWWKPDPKSDTERELLVRAYANNKRQMAVCTFIHTKGDGLTAAFGDTYTPISF